MLKSITVDVSRFRDKVSKKYLGINKKGYTMKPGHWTRSEIRNKMREVGEISFNVCHPCRVSTDMSVKQSVCLQHSIMVI